MLIGSHLRTVLLQKSRMAMTASDLKAFDNQVDRLVNGQIAIDIQHVVS